MMADFIYFIGKEGSDNGPIKVGITYHLLKRMGALQTSSPFPLVIHEFIELRETDNGAELEAVLHKVLKEKRLKGEWFDIGPADIFPAVVKAFKILGYPEPRIEDHAGVIPVPPPSPAIEYEVVSLKIEKATFDIIRDEWENWQAKIVSILKAHISVQ
jgi:hypothetical protein